jgi:uncharacterized membrane protein
MRHLPATGWLGRWTRDRRGGITVLVAVSSLVLVGFCALAVDVGSVFLDSRRMQGVADLAALAAERDIDHATAAAQATADANGAGLTVFVTTGSYVPDAATAPGQRFQAGGASPNAARVQVRGKANLYFAQVLLGKPTMDVSRTATAARAELAAFSIGSRLASLQGGLANQVLSGLAGGSVSLSVMDYNALATANVDLFRYSDALRTSAHLQAASFDKTLSSDVAPSQALSALGDVLDANGSSQAAVAVRKIAAASGHANAIQMGNLLDLGPYGVQDHVAGAGATNIQVGAMDLAQAILGLASGGRQVKLDLGASIPGLADVNVWLAIGERPNNSPWLTVDRDSQVIIRTAQTRLYVEAKALSALGLLGMQPIRLPVYLEAASAEAKLSGIECPPAVADQAASLAVRPGVGQAVIGDIDPTKLNDFKTAITPGPAMIVDILAAKITGFANVKIGGATWTTVRFTHAEIQSGAVKSVATTDIAKTTVSSLVGNLSLTVNVLGLGLGTSGITNSLSGALTAVAAPLDGVINGISDLLGLRLGEADVRVNGLRCRAAALVA